jgi:hypothetical protein
MLLSWTPPLIRALVRYTLVTCAGKLGGTAAALAKGRSRAQDRAPDKRGTRSNSPPGLWHISNTNLKCSTCFQNTICQLLLDRAFHPDCQTQSCWRCVRPSASCIHGRRCTSCCVGRPQCTTGKQGRRHNWCRKAAGRDRGHSRGCGRDRCSHYGREHAGLPMVYMFGEGLVLRYECFVRRQSLGQPDVVATEAINRLRKNPRTIAVFGASGGVRGPGAAAEGAFWGSFLSCPAKFISTGRQRTDSGCRYAAAPSSFDSRTRS